MQLRSRPLHHGDSDRSRRAGGTDGAQHTRIAERRGVTLLLQLKPALIDAAGRIDREHELKIDRNLPRRAAAGREQQRAEKN